MRNSGRAVTLIATPEAVVPPDLLERAREDQFVGEAGEVLVEVAGRTCYDSAGKGRSSHDFHAHLLESGHVNPMYHAVYVFRIEGYSRSMTKELNRHHVGCSPSERSGRFVDEGATPWTTHPALEAYRKEVADTVLEDLVFDVEDAGRRAYREVVAKVEPWLISKGLEPGVARKQARAAARQYLGNGLETEQVWSANIEAIRNVIRQRGGLGADAEIRDFAVRLAKVMQNQAPAYFDDLRFVHYGVLGEGVFCGG